MSRVLSIEVGYSLTSVCEIDYKAKSPKVYKSFTVPTLDGVLRDDVIEADTHYLEGLRGGLREHGIKAKQIVFPISSTKIATREVVIPFVKENRIGDVIKANAADYFPVELSQYELAYSIQEVMGDKAGGQQYKLLVIAVPKQILQGYYDLAASLKMTVAAFDYVGNSLFQVVRKECTEGTQLIAKIDGRSTLVMVMSGQKIMLTRNVPRGVEEALHAVMGSKVWGNVQNIRQAMETVERNACIDLEMIEEITEEETEAAASEESIAKGNVMDALVPMIGGIARVIDFYISRNPETPIDRVLITGIGANFLGLEELLHREINYPVETIKKIEGLNLEKYFKKDFFGGYLSCIGASLAPVEFIREDEKKKGSIELLPSQRDMMVVYILVFVGGVVIAAALAATSVLSYLTAVSENDRLKNRIEELAEAETIYEQYLQQQYSYNKLTFFQNSTVTPNEELVAFMGEMEQKMPSSLHVQSFNATLDGVTMSVTVENKEDAAKLIQQFRTFETIGDVIVDSINDSGAVMEGQVLEIEPMVSLTVTVSYKGNEEAAAAAAAAQAKQEAEAQQTTEETEE